MLLAGKCHCGNIAFELDWEGSPPQIPARACGCSFCVKHGGVWTSCPTGSLQVQVRRPEAVHRYVFGTKTATFHVCSECGVVPVVTCEIDGRTHAVVSVHAFENVEAGLLEPGSVSFEGEAVADRLARRARNWIPDVRFAAG